MTREESLADVYRRMARDFEVGGSALYARLVRTHADDSLVTTIGEEHEPRWEVPLRLFGGVHYLELSGAVADPWSRFRDVVTAHHEWLQRFVAEQPVQTNEVQRCWGLLPAFLLVAADKPLDLVELGPSGGLNLFWDRYRYRYDDATWGSRDAGLELTGELRAAPPGELFRRSVSVRGRVGIDRSPVDVTTDEGALLLQCFVWADQRERLQRLRRAIEVVRRDPPRLVAGDYVELLPSVLARRDDAALTVVYHSASAGYLDDDRRARLRVAIEEAHARRPLVWISYEFARDEVAYDSFALDLRLWPGGERRRLARLDGHANRLQWLG
jgi:hypothetical protein